MRRLKSHLTLIIMCALSATATPAIPAGVWTGQHMPYRAFDRLDITPIKVEGGILRVAFAPGRFALKRDDILAWLKKSAAAVATYYGAFPVPVTRVLIVPAGGRGVQGGTAFGYRGPAIRLVVGTASTTQDLDRDWKAVHEMVHLAIPNLPAAHSWFSEGLATYIEPIARAQAGHLTAHRVWREFVSDMPQGLPTRTDGGLDGTSSWGRTYWGGAIFCLAADFEIRRRSNNRLGLQDAMRGVIAAGGTHDKFWPIARILKTADRAIGMSVLEDLYNEMRATPASPNLKRIWKQLGISYRSGRIRFDNEARYAAHRRAITAPPVR